MRRIPLMLVVMTGALTAISGTALAGAVRMVASPVNSSLPTIGGTAREGQTLTASSGSWSGITPISYAYQWQRCNSAGSSCNPIGQATNQNYVASQNDVGRTIRVQVTATNADGNNQALSAATGAIADRGSAPANTKQPDPSGTPTAGQTIKVNDGNWSGLKPITFTYQWQSCTGLNRSCTDLTGATGSSFVIGASLVGSFLRAMVTATNSAGKTSSASNMTTAVVGNRVVLTARFNAALRAGQEVTRPKGTSARAAGHFTARVTGKTLRWTLTYSRLSSRPTVALLHKGVRGKNGIAFKALCRGCLSRAQGTLTLTSSQLDALMRGRAYVNVRTAKNKTGEIRGQISRVR